MIKLRLDKKTIIRSREVKTVLSEIIDNFHANGPVDPTDLEKLAYVKKFHPKIFEKYESKILHLMGLFYKPLEPKSLIELIYKAYSDDAKNEFNNSFTPLQINMLKNINNKRYFSFSSPTSSGKSYLFMELVKNRPDDIVIIVPSRALIAEYLEKVLEIVKEFKDVLVLQFVENINKKHTKRRIYILTPERARDIFRFKDGLNIGLFLFDEAQLSEEELRGLTFDSLVRRVDRVFPLATKVFAHPFINNPNAQLEKHGFSTACASKQYSQNSVGKLYLTPEKLGLFAYRPTFKLEKAYYTKSNIIKDVLQRKGATVLVYASKKKIYAKKQLKDFKKYVDLCRPVENRNALSIIKELQDYIGATKEDHKLSALVEMMRRGIVIHHGSIPLKVRFLIEKFINEGFAKICFATSTLLQGINMPFDVVWIDNYYFSGTEDEKVLALKNLIGRAGRNKSKIPEFDYGYVVVHSKNYESFLKRISKPIEITNTSNIDNEDTSKIREDDLDLVEATKKNTFDDELQITEVQKERLKDPEVSLDIDVKLVLDNLFIDRKIITAEDYGDFDSHKKAATTNALKNIFVKHLRRSKLEEVEQRILTTALRILLWRIQGRSFSQVVAFRYNYLANINEQRRLKRNLDKKIISKKEWVKQNKEIELRFSQVAKALPNKDIRWETLFGKFIGRKYVAGKLMDFDYDNLVYDTYEYLDTVISLSLSSPLSAAFQIYFDKTKDLRAKSMVNYLKYGTDNSLEIMLLRYGFEFEDMDWLKEHIKEANEDEIIFHKSIVNLETNKQKLISRYNNQ